MIIPVFLWLCDTCESESAMTTSDSKPPLHWTLQAERVMCGACGLEEAEMSLGVVPSGVVLTIAERCP